MTFQLTDFDGMYKWIISLPSEPRLRRARLVYFNLLRYREDYDGLYDFIISLGGHIQEDA